jgi:hypothetical protein
MLPIKSWRIYYADGSSFSSEDGTWAEAPPFGVQAVVYYHLPPHKTIDGGQNNGDIYTWLGEDSHPDYQGIKMGLWMDREGAYRVQKLAFESTTPEVE